MISVIVCSRNPPENTLHCRNVFKTVGTDHEYIPLDNRQNRYGICAAYNEGVKRSRGDILVFVHEDVFFMEQGWGAVLESKFTDATVGMVGVAGTRYLFADRPGWVVAGRPFIRGRVIHEAPDKSAIDLTVFSWDKRDADVVAVDGLFFAIRRRLFTTIRFDEQTFDGFHFYDMDICMQVRQTHRILVTWGIMVKHLSGGNFGTDWQKYATRFTNKYRLQLPATCDSDVPDPARRISFETFNLTGRVPQLTIA